MEFRLQVASPPPTKGGTPNVVSAKLDASAALAATGSLPENVNYAVKSREERHISVPNFRDADTASLPFLESVPEVADKLKEPIIVDRKFGDVVKSAKDAAVLVLVY